DSKFQRRRGPRLSGSWRDRSRGPQSAAVHHVLVVQPSAARRPPGLCTHLRPLVEGSGAKVREVGLAVFALGIVSPSERGNFAAVSAKRQGAPAPPVRPGIVVEEETAGGVGAATNARRVPFDDHLSGRPCDSRQKPIKPAFSRYILEAPSADGLNQLVVA